MTPEQAAQLNRIASDVEWLKGRVGGVSSSPPLASVPGDVEWLKLRIGGSGNAPSITDRLRAIQGEA